MNKELNLEDKLHLEEVILDPLNRSQGRYKKIIEYVTKYVQIEHWAHGDNKRKDKIKKRQVWIDLNINDKFYSNFIDYQEGADIKALKSQLIATLADKIFEDN